MFKPYWGIFLLKGNVDAEVFRKVKHYFLIYLFDKGEFLT